MRTIVYYPALNIAPDKALLFFSSLGRSPGRAIALSVASASASTFTLKFFKSLYFPGYLIDLVHIWYDDIVPSFI